MEPDNGNTLSYKEVSPEITEKVLRLAMGRETFSIKDVFEANPNNPEFQLRYALNNLRLAGKIFKFGEKRGAYYSIHNEEEKANPENGDLRTALLAEIKKHSGRWFKRTDLKLDDHSVPNILLEMKKLIDESVIDKRGELRWTEYLLKDNVTPVEATTNESRNGYIELVLNYIKKAKVVTIPMIVENLEIQRNQVIPVIEQLVRDEEIWHEGLGRGSKYIYKDVPYSDVEKIVDGLNAERKISQKIDELSDFLCSDEVTAVSIGRKKKDNFQVRFISGGESRKTIELNSLEEVLQLINHMTVLR